ncbi:MAG: hypothetical protein Pg6A_06220 [Termitinemataceae bacterium]|nr:MAG: hypothetical protein Pg6A_06220 [Termitinemataceae bacterium]
MRKNNMLFRILLSVILVFAISCSKRSAVESGGNGEAITKQEARIELPDEPEGVEEEFAGTAMLTDMWTKYLKTPNDINRGYLGEFERYVEVFDLKKRIDSKAMNAAQKSGVVPQNTERRIFIQYENGFFAVDFPYGNKIYKLKDISRSIGMGYLGGIKLSYHPFGGTDSVSSKGSYFNIDDKPVKFEVTPISAGMTINAKQHFTFSTKGKNKFYITLGDKKFFFSFEVIEMPFTAGDSVDSVLEQLGFPAKENMVPSVSEDEGSKNYEGIDYGRTSSATHYYYEAYPFMAVSINNNSHNVKGIGNIYIGYDF